MNFTLSPGMQVELQSTSGYLYALKYLGGQFVGSVHVLAGPGNIPTGSIPINVDDLTKSGQVLVLLERGGNGSLGSTISTMDGGNNEAISPNTSLGSAAQQPPTTPSYSPFQYQLIEATIGGVVDVSSVNTFGFPISISNANGTRGFVTGFNGTSTKNALEAFAQGTVSPNNLAVGPASGVNSIAPLTNAWPASDWTNYVNGLATGSNGPAMQAKIEIVTVFNSTTISDYTVTYDNTPTDSNYGYFVFTPNTALPNANTDYIRIKLSSVISNIYAQKGTSGNGDSIEISTDGGNTYAVQPIFLPNTADGSVAQYFVAGFDANYWGGFASSPNPNDTSTVIDLNKTWNWGYNYVYGTTQSDTKIAVYNNHLGSGTGTAGNRYSDPWAQTIQSSTNSYGWSFGDLISQGSTNPQLALPGGGDIAVTVFSNSETISSGGFLAPPPSYVPPPTSTPLPSGLPAYSPVSVPTTFNANSIGFNFNVGGIGNPNQQTPATLKIYAPTMTPFADANGFINLDVTNAGGFGNGFSVVSSTATGFALASNGAAGQGQFTIYNLPVTSDGSAAWYQLVFGAPGAQTVYNVYAKANSSGAFLPNDLSGSPPTYNFVVDHGLGYGVAKGIVGSGGNYTVSLAAAGVLSYDVATFSAPGTIFGTNGNDSLTGTGGADTLNGKPGNDTINGLAGTDTAVSWEVARNFALKATAGSGTITLQDKVGTDGTDTLTGIENIQFRDVTIDATSITKTAGLARDQVLKVVDLYTAGLNRAPDALGLDYHAGRLADGASISEISKVIFSSPEAAPIYGLGNSTPVFVNLAYQTAFGHAADAAGAAFWINELDTGHLQRTDLVTALIAGVRGPGGNAADAQYVANKEAVGAHFALTQGLNNAAWARTVEGAVNGTAASVTAANAQTDAFALVAAAPATSELVVQIVGLVP